MSDLEGLAKRLFLKGFSRSLILERLASEVTVFKDVAEQDAYAFAEAVLSEVEASLRALANKEVGWILRHPKSGATMHDLGVGCRGEGDFFVHQLLSEIADIGVARVLGPKAQDDAGIVGHEGRFIVVAVDGTHSRLTEFPFIAGFHVTRAAMRDVYVKGAKPVALFTDLHLADDGDIGVLFDFMGGVRAVSQLSGVPLVAGSTLRVGGDMVIGTRFVSCVGAVGVIEREDMIAARRRIKPGDDVIMTEGAGGGTIATTAIYSGMPEVLLETLNIQFIEACEALRQSGLFSKIHAATDWTNGGLRGDCSEICRTVKVGMKIYEEKVRSLLNKKVLSMLDTLSIDYLGVSMDALLIFSPPEHTKEVLYTLKKVNVKCDVVGEVISDPARPILVSNGKETCLEPLYREAAYTKIKKLVGEEAPLRKEEFMASARRAALESLEKTKRVIELVTRKRREKAPLQ